MTTGPVQPAIPAPISWAELLAAGRATLIPQPPDTQPPPAAIRRAISTAYYAAFHALAATNAHALIGFPQDQLTADAWTRAYRRLDHNQAKTQLQYNRPNFSVNAQVFADLFCDLQNERHNADYNPSATFTLQTATTWLNNAEDAINDYLQTTLSERTAIAVLTLIRPR